MSRQQLTFTAPAKINLYLRVLGRRHDGFHELDTLFLPLALADRLELSYEPEVSDPSQAGVSCTCPGHAELEGEHNLATRAAQTYLEACRLTEARVELTVHKAIWVAAGLGGGSSDAAAVLLALTRLAPGLAGAELRSLARGLGADVPFFLAPRPALARGIGDELDHLPGPLAAQNIVLVNPGHPLRTAEVFAGLQLDVDDLRPPDPPPVVSDLDGLAALIHNDLQAVATGLRPEIAEMQQLLLSLGAVGAGMSGSGPTVFGLFRGPGQAAAAAQKILNTTGFLATATCSLAA